MADEKLTPSEVAIWRATRAYTPAEAAWLLMDKAPQTIWIDDTKGAAFALACQIREEFRTSDYGAFGTPRESIAFDVRYEGEFRGIATIEGGRRQRITFDELRQFAEQRGLKPMILSAQEPAGADDDREPDPRHRKTLLRIIAALMKLAKIDSDMATKTAAHAINSVLEETGRSMKPDTIARVLNDAREVD
ncbi:hypothetical protein [Thiocystis violacea]|uniref:hypothetical protein n=1 Tax=Thiocystis violacea TaxID=13725 RepID=UPI001904506D|nr:hypothetical protein [Thiocystis violacea]MBK1716842.1 hypothetical protein [Thiocystis violacea]